MRSEESTASNYSNLLGSSLNAPIIARSCRRSAGSASCCNGPPDSSSVSSLAYPSPSSLSRLYLRVSCIAKTTQLSSCTFHQHVVDVACSNITQMPFTFAAEGRLHVIKSIQQTICTAFINVSCVIIQKQFKPAPGSSRAASSLVLLVERRCDAAPLLCQPCTCVCHDARRCERVWLTTFKQCSASELHTRGDTQHKQHAQHGGAAVVRVMSGKHCKRRHSTPALGPLAPAVHLD